MASPVPVAEYASPEVRRRFPTGDYLMFAAVVGFVVGVLAAPLLIIDRLRNIYEDLKLKLPGSTQLLIDLYSTLNQFGARFWIWLIPLLIPLWLVRLDREVRFRATVALLLLAGLAIVWFVLATVSPMLLLFEGLFSR